MILGLQITGVVFALIMIYFATLHYKRKTLNGMEIGVWIIIWSLVIIISIFPAIFRIYSQAIAVSRLLDILIAGGFILVLALTAASYIRTKRLEKKLEELIRKLAIRESQKKK